jgi:hypothetical protein
MDIHSSSLKGEIMKAIRTQHTLKSFVLAAAVLGNAGFLIGAHAATATGDATATVIEPITITKTANLRFGKLAGGAGGTVVVSSAGSRTKSGGVFLSPSDTGGAASFDVTGEPNATYSITLPTSVSLVSGSNSMSLDTFTSDLGATGTLSALGAQTMNVGGTLTVAANQAAGSYAGSFNVSVDYN